MIITILSKVTGFFRDIVLSHFYGASSISDAYIVSITISSVLFSLIITGISTAYIPMYKQIEYDVSRPAAISFTSNLINIIMIITTIIIGIGLIFPYPIVKVFALGFDSKTLETAVIFTRIGIIGIYFTSLTQLLVGYLQLNGKFVIPAMIGFPFNLIIILSIYVSAQTNIILLAIGSVLAALFQFIFLFPSLSKTPFRYSPNMQFKDPHIKKMSLIVFPIMIGISIDQINLMVDKTLASTIVEGGISALTYASRLNDFVQGIFVLSFVTVMFPVISNLAAQKNIAEFKKSISEVISSVILIVVPASVGMMILSKPIIRLLFGHGNFDEQAIQMTSQALFYYSIGMIGYAIREILNRTFYSLQDSKTPMINASFAVVLNIVLNIILSSFMGLKGLALATSISALICSLLLGVNLRKKIGPFGIKENMKTLLKVISASSMMGIVIYLMNENAFTNWSASLKIIVVIIIGVITYFILLVFLKVKELKMLIQFIKGKIQL